jgi:hypothetical protein
MTKLQKIFVTLAILCAGSVALADNQWANPGRFPALTVGPDAGQIDSGMIVNGNLQVTGTLSAASLTLPDGLIVSDGGTFDDVKTITLEAGAATLASIDAGPVGVTSLIIGGGSAITKAYNCTVPALTTGSGLGCNTAVASTCAGAAVGDRCILASPVYGASGDAVAFEPSGAGTGSTILCNFIGGTASAHGTQTATCFH